MEENVKRHMGIATPHQISTNPMATPELPLPANGNYFSWQSHFLKTMHGSRSSAVDSLEKKTLVLTVILTDDDDCKVCFVKSNLSDLESRNVCHRRFQVLP